MEALSERRVRTTLLGAFVVLSWMILWAWGQTPYGQHFQHTATGAASLRDGLGPLFSFALGWALMTVAMMLPTTFPLVSLFYRMVSDREHRVSLMALCVAGYLVVWVMFGVLAHFVVSQVYPLVAAANFTAALLVTAGIYQFTPLKHYCLRKCRSPRSFIISHWHGKNESSDSFWLGVHHGLFCIGCCWSLMLLMFAAVSVHFLWMLALGTVMAVEKNFSWGERISTPVGVLLIVSGVIPLLV
jgi:predicted metal-binding membrane protein